MANTRSNKQLSRDLSNLLDDLGFGKLQRWERIHHWNIQTRVKDLSIKLCINTNNERVFVGSQPEGIGLCGMADVDVLQVEHDVLCVNQTKSVSIDNRLVLRLMASNAPPGYCFLEMSNSDSTTETLDNNKYALVERNEKRYFSSKFFLMKHNDDNVKVSEYMNANTRYYAQHGPSIPKLVSKPLQNILCSWFGLNMNDKIDFVRALPCDGYLALESWQKRPRLNNWPSKKMVRHIMTLPIYVVPVGMPGSLNEDIQWRISFVRAETYLVQSLNTVQAMILVLLKLIVKHYIEQDCPCITSYILKNVMFWLAESIPQTKFRRKHLVARLQDALVMLKESVSQKKLPSYMQEDKYVLANTLTTAQQEAVLSKIDYLLQNGQIMIHACLYNGQSVNTIYNDLIQHLWIFNVITKVEICRLAMYSFERQVFFYLTTYKLTCEEEQILNNIATLPKLIRKYGKKCLNDITTVNLHNELADLDRDEKKRKTKSVMLQTSDKIQKDVSLYCALVWFFGCFMRMIVVLCKTVKHVWKIAFLFVVKVDSWITKSKIRLGSVVVSVLIYLFCTCCWLLCCNRTETCMRSTLSIVKISMAIPEQDTLFDTF